VPLVKIDLSKGVYRNADGEQVREFPLYRMDCFLDALGGTTGRPAFRVLSGNAGGPQIKGIYTGAVSGNLYTYTQTALYKLTGLTSTSGGTASFLGTVGGSNARATFAETADGKVFIAAGERIYYTDGTTFTAMADADAPITVSHVSFLDGYILATDGTKYMKWADVTDPTNWTATSFASAEGSPDPINAHHVHNRLIYLFGPRSIEVWENDGSNPFSRVSGGYLQHGLGAVYSVIPTEDALYFLNHKRRLCKISGSQVEVISSPYDEEVRKLINVSDCLGSLIEVGGYTFLKFYYPQAQRSLVYCVTTDSWSEWGKWNDAGGNYLPLPIAGTFFDPVIGRTLAYDNASPYLYYPDPTVYSEGDGALLNSRIRPQLKTQSLSHGFTATKRSNWMAFTAKSGAVDLSTAPSVLVRWRNNDSGTWSNEKTLSLGAIGQGNPLKKIRRTGFYRFRQYEITFPDAAPSIQLEMEEDVDVLSR
jgi:hypothetical protein